jgi:hypothetical protein
MSTAWADCNLPALVGLEHWLKGTCSCAGFRGFVEPGRTLERLAAECRIGDVIVLLEEMADRIVID